MKFFGRDKYLIVVYLVERKVTKINKSTQDTVYEEFENFYQVNCLNLSRKDNQIPIWEVTPDDITNLDKSL